MLLRAVDKSKLFFFSGVTLLALLGGYLLGVAISLRVDLFDSYAIYLNARQIAEARPILYYWKSSPLLSLLYAPFFSAEHFFSWADFAVTADRITAVFFYLLWVVFAYKLLSLCLAPLKAFAGALLLALNPLIIHYAPFPKEDLPGAVFVALCFYFYLVFKEKGRVRDLVRASLCAGAAMSLRQQFMFLIPCTVLLYETAIRILEPGRVVARIRHVIGGWLWSSVCFFFLPVLVPVVLTTCIYAFLGIDTAFHAPVRFSGEILQHLKVLASHRSYWWEGYAFLIQGCGWAIILPALFGMGSVLARKDGRGSFFLLWFWVFFIFQAHLIRHLEARFFFGAYTPFYVFAGIGFWRLYGVLSEPPGGSFSFRHAVRILLCVAVAGSALWPALSECRKFRDPFYREDFAKKVAVEADRLRDHGRVFWYGEMYPLHPKEFVFHPEDEATYLFHVYNHTLSFFLRRRIPVYVPAGGFLAMPGGKPVFANGAFQMLHDGDVMVVSTESKISTRDVPAHVPPLVIQRVRKLMLKAVGIRGECVVLSDKPGAAAQGISICRESDGYVMRGWGLPNRFMEINVVIRGRKGLYVLAAIIAKPVQGEFVQSLDLPKDVFLPWVLYADVLYYDAVKSIAPVE